MIERILIVEDELNLRKLLLLMLQKYYHVVTVDNGEQAIKLIQQQFFDLILLDNRLPSMTGLEMLKTVKHCFPDMLVILMTAYADVETAVEALQSGAFDYIVKPFDLNQFDLLIKRTLALKKANKQTANHFAEIKQLRSYVNGTIVTKSRNMMELCRDIAKVSQTKTTVLITGESGTGKELVAKNIHDYSSRSTKPFIKINCGALPETLLESTLFGHEKGAFTGAYQRQIGLFERVHQGTLFLDEVSEMSVNLQVKLLRVIQEREFEPIGSNKLLKTDFRLVAATNISLLDMVNAGKFRQDLFYRLNVMSLNLPPLRERKQDIMLLARYFVQRFCEENNKQLLDFTDKTVEIFNQYHWPGNVRELSNVIEYAVIMSHGLLIDSQDLPQYMQGQSISSNSEAHHIRHNKIANTLKQKVKNYERVLIEDELRKNQGHRENTAKSLGISRRTLIYKIQEHNIIDSNMK